MKLINSGADKTTLLLTFEGDISKIVGWAINTQHSVYIEDSAMERPFLEINFIQDKIQVSVSAHLLRRDEGVLTFLIFGIKKLYA